MLSGDDIIELYDRHASGLLAFFARRTMEPEAAVDLVAETFAIAYAKRRRARARDAEGQVAWLYAIARNQLTDHHRRGFVERKALRRLGIDRRPLTDSEIERIEELAGLESMRAAIADGLAQLSEPHRNALQLRVVEERSYPDIAAALGVTEQTARARVSRALSALRDDSGIDALRKQANHA